MNRRQRANRAEAIVKGIGGLVMLGVLMLVMRILPQILKRETTSEMMDTMMKIIIGFVVLAGIISFVGLIVWVKVRRSDPWEIDREWRE
jgi:hypothetical protein